MKTFKTYLTNSFTSLALIALVGGVIYSCNCKKDVNAGAAAVTADTDSASATTDTVEVAGTLDADGNFVRDAGAMQEITLADGTKLNVGANSAEFKLFNNINGDYKIPAEGEVGANDWIVLDRVFFASGGDNLNESSTEQVSNIAKIMKAYPNSSLKLGGYTDNTGSAAANKTVSQQRADKVKSTLVADGIATDRITTQGFGPEFPVCPANDTDECKAQNRRVDVRLTAK